MSLYDSAYAYVKFQGYDDLGSALFYAGLLMKLGDLAAGDRLLYRIPDMRLLNLRYVRDLVNQSIGRLVEKGKMNDDAERIMKEFFTTKISEKDEKVSSENITFYLMAGYTFYTPNEAYDEKGNFTPRSLV